MERITSVNQRTYVYEREIIHAHECNTGRRRERAAFCGGEASSDAGERILRDVCVESVSRIKRLRKINAMGVVELAEVVSHHILTKPTLSFDETERLYCRSPSRE